MTFVFGARAQRESVEQGEGQAVLKNTAQPNF